MNRWIALGLLIAGPVAAQQRAAEASDCEDAFLECKEDCLIRWGGTTDLKKRAKNNQCINKCSSVDRDCREAFMETRKNNLDEGSLKGSPSSRDVDSDGLPTKTAQKKPPPPPKDDDVREDNRREEKPAPAKPEIAPEETPKSNRTTLKTDPKDKPVESPKAEPKSEPKQAEKPVEKSAPPPKRDEPPPPREEPKREEPKAEEAPPPKKEKREEKRDESKEKKRALDEWDPDAF